MIAGLLLLHVVIIVVVGMGTSKTWELSSIHTCFFLTSRRNIHVGICVPSILELAMFSSLEIMVITSSSIPSSLNWDKMACLP